MRERAKKEKEKRNERKLIRLFSIQTLKLKQRLHLKCIPVYFFFFNRINHPTCAMGIQQSIYNSR